MKENESIYNLSRRRVLGGLGAIGLASAGAGLGTTAFFSDEEHFEGNVLTAGELNLVVNYHTFWDQGSAGADSRVGSVDGTTVSAILDDMKPGDSGILGFCFEIVDNPAYLWTCGTLVANDDNGSTEPEVNHSPDTTFGAGEGELADAIMVDVYYGNIVDDGDFDPSDVTLGAQILDDVTLAEFLAELETGLPLDGAATAGILTPGDQAPYAGSREEEAADNPCLIVDWGLPADVGNEIQTDSVEFDMVFSAQQARHNDGTENPCVSIEHVCGEGWGKLSIDDFGTSAMQAKVRSPNSGHEVFAGSSFNSAATISSSEASVPDGSFAPFLLEYDGAGTLTWTYNGVTNTYGKADLGVPQDKIEITLRADTAGATSEVRNVELETGSIVEPIADFQATPDGKKYCGLTGVLDLADGFTLTGEVMLDYEPTVTSELVAMYVHVDTSP